jgi:hypothetical protein
VQCPLCAKSGQSAAQQRVALFDHRVGAREHRCGNVDADRLGSLDVDGKLKLGALGDGQIAGFQPLRMRLT